MFALSFQKYRDAGLSIRILEENSLDEQKGREVSIQWTAPRCQFITANVLSEKKKGWEGIASYQGGGEKA